MSGGMQEIARKLVADEVLRARSARDWGMVSVMEAECGNVDGVRRAHREIKKQSENAFNDEQYRMAVAKAQAKSGLVDDARETARTVSDYKFYDLTAREVAAAFVATGRLIDALEINETIDPSERNSWTYYETLLDVAEVDFEQANPERAKTLLKKARKHVQSMELTLNRSDFSKVGEVHGKLGFEAEFQAWADSLEHPYAKATALIGLANGILNRAKEPK